MSDYQLILITIQTIKHCGASYAYMNKETKETTTA